MFEDLHSIVQYAFGIHDDDRRDALFDTIYRLCISRSFCILDMRDDDSACCDQFGYN